MPQISEELMAWVDLLAKLGQLLFGLVAVILAVLAVLAKGRDIWRTELAKKQIDELGRVRDGLQLIWFDFQYLPEISKEMDVMGWNFEQLRQGDPDAWEQCQRYKTTSLALFYKFSDPDYYLFPKWISSDLMLDFSSSMREFAPFTLRVVLSKSEGQRKLYSSKIIAIRKSIDQALRKNA